MSYEPRARVKSSRILAVLVGAAVALSACTPTAENPMTGSSNPSDPATVKAQVEELKQALKDLHAFKTETQKAIGPQKWADEGLRNSACNAGDGREGVNYSVMSQTMETLDLEASTKVVKTLWESKAFTTRTESNPLDPGLIRLYANQNGGHLISFTANVKGSGLEMDSACIAGDQHEIYKELDRQEASASPSPITK
ncbi:hypothetical protein SAMN04487917_106270 [Arthrobacter sp. yr096]|uniref:hypothetical protein n=1 Tax=Arthrobacter sp. yr096 TaxID=1761750 RepID=UPI0008BC66EA|nr:hypothetical protein [Arthrobacter sp. yr096]SEJ51405.1 hypothetical protein SAMN04487917_106270 [Arthrobacter sp. yr096]